MRNNERLRWGEDIEGAAVNGQQTNTNSLLSAALAPREFRKTHAWGEDMRGSFASFRLESRMEVHVSGLPRFRKTIYRSNLKAVFQAICSKRRFQVLSEGSTSLLVRPIVLA